MRLSQSVGKIIFLDTLSFNTDLVTKILAYFTTAGNISGNGSKLNYITFIIYVSNIDIYLTDCNFRLLFRRPIKSIHRVEAGQFSSVPFDGCKFKM